MSFSVKIRIFFINRLNLLASVVLSMVAALFTVTTTAHAGSVTSRLSPDDVVQIHEAVAAFKQMMYERWGQPRTLEDLTAVWGWETTKPKVEISKKLSVESLHEAISVRGLLDLPESNFIYRSTVVLRNIFNSETFDFLPTNLTRPYSTLETLKHYLEYHVSKSHPIIASASGSWYFFYVEHGRFAVVPLDHKAADILDALNFGIQNYEARSIITTDQTDCDFFESIHVHRKFQHQKFSNGEAYHLPVGDVYCIFEDRFGKKNDYLIDLKFKHDPSYLKKDMIYNLKKNPHLAHNYAYFQDNRLHFHLIDQARLGQGTRVNALAQTYCLRDSFMTEQIQTRLERLYLSSNNGRLQVFTPRSIPLRSDLQKDIVLRFVHNIGNLIKK